MATIFPDNRREQFLERPLPSSEDSERVILGSILLDNDVISQAAEVLTPDDFYSPLNRRVFAAMLSLFGQTKKIDPIVIGEELKLEGSLESIGGITTITNMTFGLPHLPNVEEYIEIVEDTSAVRRLIRTMNNLTSRALAQEDHRKDLFEAVEKEIFKICEDRAHQKFAKIAPVAEQVLHRVKEYATGEGTGITGLTTGFVELDEMLSGLQRTDLIIIAGRPSMGKTALALTMAQNAALKSNAVVAVFSLEMSKEQLVTRMMSSEARINAHRFRTGRLVPAEWERLGAAIGTLANTQIFIDDTPGITSMEIRAKCRRLKAEQKALDLVVIDYLQLMGGNRRSENRQQEVSQISRELKALAKEMDVPVLALSQLSRAPEGRNPPKPLMSDLRESGSIEQDADVVGFIYREDYYKETEENKGIADIIISKQRNGPTGTVKLAFLREFTRFEAYFGG